MVTRLTAFVVFVMAAQGAVLPAVAQLQFDYYEMGAWGINQTERSRHPKGTTLTIGVMQDLSRWNACVYYHSSVDTSNRQSRVVARCNVWRDGEQLERRQISEEVTFLRDDLYGWQASSVCACRTLVLDTLETGDLLQCDVRFRRFPSLVMGDDVGIWIGIAGSLAT